MSQLRVSAIKLHRQRQILALTFSDGMTGSLSAEFLRVHSPSAEVQQHGNPILLEGKQDVKLLDVQAVGHYAVRLIFDDGHDTGIYSWDWLHRLVRDHDALWQDYQQRCAAKQALHIPVNVRFSDD
ncbi:DUF971 domain-containing protein [Neiella marina]|uniref:DUF971 domain-containing protein n=1 Tax=Neiella holothuriorum TaxID=2870530 RepID=A0ABS7ECJ2_9GAMM|nr:DUF971 domain-containing protein [Neiella holothuriorum]MBW8190054.1 DUF971 domain-containing protein [Neiella holothuriorum]